MAEALTLERTRTNMAAAPILRTTDLVVPAMHCGGCMRKVEGALSRHPGVTAARANLSLKRVAVVHDPCRAAAADLIQTLDRAGFQASELVLERDDAGRARDVDFLARLGVAGFAAANIMLLSVSVWSGMAGDMPASIQTLFHWLSALIALPAVAYAGQPFFRSAARALKARRVNMDLPISLGVTLATAMSLYQTARGSEQVYFDAAVTLLFFLLIGRYLDQRVRSRAAGAAANLLGLGAVSALVLREDGTAERIAARALTPGQRVVVAAGERIAVDGRVQEGTSDIDQSLITGESQPRRVGPGAEVYAGTVNLSGPLVVEATAADQNTLLAEIGRLMAAAEQARGRYVRLADRAARLYAPAVHVLGAATFLGWLAAGQGWEAALTAAIAVLIITCPCALALAVPAVQVAAVSRLFAGGVLIKAPDALERLAEVERVVLDKTGTLTAGEPELADAETMDLEILTRAARLAAVSRHPYARAIARAVEADGVRLVPAEGVREAAGAGLARTTGAGEERLGSAAWCGVEPVAAGEAASVWYRPVCGAPIAFRFEDRLRPDARAVIGQMQKAGLEVELLSGDRACAVERSAKAAGIARWRGEATPADKIARLEALQQDGRRVLMVGDGLNDAPALAASHASLSPATAADISQTAADGVFQGARLQPVVEAVAVARAARRLALQNFAIAIGYNLVFVPLAAAGLVTPLIAAIAMSASSIAVTGNAVRLRTQRLELSA